MQNLITDVVGLTVGHAHDATICSGVSVVLAEAGCTAAVDVRGGGPGTLETDALSADGTVDVIHGIVLSGGSAFGMAASSGVRDWLSGKGIGFAIRDARVPIVAQAILFDLLNGGTKDTLSQAYAQMGEAACAAATGGPFEIGSVGAGFGATTADLRGGLGSASEKLANGVTVGAMVAANPVGQVTVGDGPQFWAAPFERGSEFGGLGLPADPLGSGRLPRLKGGPGEATTLAVVATDALLTKAQARRLAIMAQTGLARAIHPVHTPLDGDVVFALATGAVPLGDPTYDLAVLGSAAADVLTRAVARGVYAAAPVPAGWQGPPSYAERFGPPVTNG